MSQKMTLYGAVHTEIIAENSRADLNSDNEVKNPLSLKSVFKKKSWISLDQCCKISVRVLRVAFTHCFLACHPNANILTTSEG